MYWKTLMYLKFSGNVLFRIPTLVLEFMSPSNFSRSSIIFCNSDINILMSFFLLYFNSFSFFLSFIFLVCWFLVKVDLRKFQILQAVFAFLSITFWVASLKLFMIIHWAIMSLFISFSSTFKSYTRESSNWSSVYFSIFSLISLFLNFHIFSIVIYINRSLMLKRWIILRFHPL